MKEFLFKVRIKTSSSPTIQDVASFIKTALQHWGGGGDPEGDFFPDQIKHVGVTGKNFSKKKERR